MFCIPTNLRILWTSLALCGVVIATIPCQTGSCATKFNFAPDDILEGKDGLPPHPLQPLPYGKPVYPVTVDGQGLEMPEAHLGYWEGKYYMYSSSWACGGSLFYFAGSVSSEYPSSPTYPPGDYGADGNCGIKTYSSPDLTNWELVDSYQPGFAIANVTKPVVRYSNATEQYVMFMGGGTSIYYATSKSPGGPWSSPPGYVQGVHLSHDFDIIVAPDGTHYILTDPFEDLLVDPVQNTYVFNLWIQQLAPNLTSTMNTSETTVLIRSASELLAQNLMLEASGAFYKDGLYYLMFGMACQNCAGYIYYYYSNSPLGPYEDGGFVSQDGCGGQNKGSNVLPTASGETVVVGGIMGYRTGPTNYVYHGAAQGYIFHADNHQAASSTYFYPLEFNDDHTIKPYNCSSHIEIPLMSNESSPVPPAPYQLDCRVRNWRNIEATYATDKAGSVLEFPVWQRTDNLGPTYNAGPVLDGPLNVTLTYADGEIASFSWVASNISWAPAKITMDVSGKDISKITLSTNATNGCYGTMVQPKMDETSQYGASVLGAFEEQAKAELFVHQW